MLVRTSLFGSLGYVESLLYLWKHLNPYDKFVVYGNSCVWFILVWCVRITVPNASTYSFYRILRVFGLLIPLIKCNRFTYRAWVVDRSLQLVFFQNNYILLTTVRTFSPYVLQCHRRRNTSPRARWNRQPPPPPCV